MQNNYEEVAGTYWLTRNQDNTLWLSQGNKPTRLAGGYYTIPFPNKKGCMNWLMVGEDNGDPICKEGLDETPFTKELIEGLKFPKVTWEDGPLEIEITKSGKVYWYES